MNHRLQQIGSDGSLKLGERWLGALRALQADSASTPVLELSLAAWVNATRPAPTGGQTYGTTDPAADALAQCWLTTKDPSALVGALLRVIGAADLSEQSDLTSSVAGLLPALRAGRIEL